jgi:uncharacterized protein YbjT (DUF2867 family)
MNNILVLGGSGFVGSNLCGRWIKHSGGAGGRLAVPTRRPQRARHIQLLPSVEVVPADLHDDAQLARLVQGRDAVVNLVAILHGSASDFQHVHVDLPRRLASACRSAGVRRLVHVSALGAAAEAPSHYLRSKAAGEAVLTTAAELGQGLDLTLLRPSVIFGEHDHFLNLFARLQRVLPVMPLAGHQARFQPVWVEDVAEAIVRCLEDPTTIGDTIECAGPKVYTLGELVRLAGQWSGHPRPILPLPMALGTLQALTMELLPGEPLISRDNLASMRVPNVASGHGPGLSRLGITPASLESVMPPLLGRHNGPARLDPWRARPGQT